MSWRRYNTTRVPVAPLDHSHTPYTSRGNIEARQRRSGRGRPRSLDAVRSLALVLAWTRTKSSEFALCMLFVADGLKLYPQQSGDSAIENMLYSGWQHDHYVSNVMVFVPDGTVVACALNAPGVMHNSQIAEWGGV